MPFGLQTCRVAFLFWFTVLEFCVLVSPSTAPWIPVSVDGASADDRPSIELPTDSFTATFLVTNAQPEAEPEAEASSSSSSRPRDGTSLIATPAPRRIPRGSSPASGRVDRSSSDVVCPSFTHHPTSVGLPKSFAPRPPVPPIPEASRADLVPEAIPSHTAATGGRVGVVDEVDEVRSRAFTVFDVVFGDHSDVVCLQRALANAPFLYPGWPRPAVEILPLPVPQFVLLRPGTLCTIVVDVRSLGSDLFTLETPFSASPEELLERAALFLGNAFAEAQGHEHVQCYFNDVQWAMPLKRQLVNGDVFSCRTLPEGPGRPLLGPGGARLTLQRRRGFHFEVLRAVELGSQTLTLNIGDRMLEDVLAELVFRRHQLGPVPEGLCMQFCPVQPAPTRDRRELIILLFREPLMAPFRLSVMVEMFLATSGSLRLMGMPLLGLSRSPDACPSSMGCPVLLLHSFMQGQ